jgi:hypothetical protein
MSDQYADWDGAYLLGALSPAERSEYEQHLRTCRSCAAALAEISGLPSLLSRLPAEDAAPLLAPAGPPPASVLSPFPPRRRARLRRIAVALAATVGLLAAVFVGGLVLRPAPPANPDRTVALAPVASSPLTARVALTSTRWGTQVDLTCTYAAGYGEEHAYRLVLLDAAGDAVQVSEWHAGPGQTTVTSGSTRLPVKAISRVELQRLDGTVLLAQHL